MPSHYLNQWFSWLGKCCQQVNFEFCLHVSCVRTQWYLVAVYCHPNKYGWLLICKTALTDALYRWVSTRKIAMEFRLSCTNPSIWRIFFKIREHSTIILGGSMTKNLQTCMHENTETCVWINVIILFFQCLQWWYTYFEQSKNFQFFFSLPQLHVWPCPFYTKKCSPSLLFWYEKILRLPPGIAG